MNKKKHTCAFCGADEANWFFRGNHTCDACKKFLLTESGVEYLNYRKRHLLKHDTHNGEMTPSEFVAQKYEMNKRIFGQKA